MCGVALAFALAITPASYSDAAPAPAARAEAPHSVAGEPLYADIIRRAQKLEAEVAALRTPDRKASATAAPLPGFDRIKAEAAQLAELDMQGHRDLAARGTDGDLKCILRGISEDMAGKLAAVEAATTGPSQDVALDELRHLLIDNREVITAPPAPPA
ncbi:MAG: hypothetical protein K1X35_10080 [Caulobacteraceae bacterium]|nr:hypothetical protein [Caulobacteraceae bacterium]